MMQVHTPDPLSIPDYICLLSEAHGRSGMSLREVAQASDLDPTYVHYILKGARRPQRDVHRLRVYLLLRARRGG